MMVCNVVFMKAHRHRRNCITPSLQHCQLGAYHSNKSSQWNKTNPKKISNKDLASRFYLVQLPTNFRLVMSFVNPLATIIRCSSPTECSRRKKDGRLLVVVPLLDENANSKMHAGSEKECKLTGHSLKTAGSSCTLWLLIQLKDK